MSAIVPPWLRQANTPQPPLPLPLVLPQVAVAPAPPPAPPEPVAPPAQRPDSYGFTEPPRWLWDGGKRREPVLDHDHTPPRIVRYVGWRICVTCARPFFTEDVVALRMCAGCKTILKAAGGTD